MNTSFYPSDQTALLLVDPYNDFLSEGGKLWPAIKETAEACDLLVHLREAMAAVRQADIQVFIVPHHRWCAGDYKSWLHPTPFQIVTGEQQIFEAGKWGGEWRTEFAPQPGDIVIKEHWAQNGFANTDLDQQLKQHGIRKIILVGVVANTCVEATGRFGMELGYHVTLVSDATAAFSQEGMHAAHDVNGPSFAHSIVTTAELVRTIQETKTND